MLAHDYSQWAAAGPSRCAILSDILEMSFFDFGVHKNSVSPTLESSISMLRRSRRKFLTIFGAYTVPTLRFD